MGDIALSVCYRPPDQDKEVDGGLLPTAGRSLTLQVLVFMGDLNQPNIYLLEGQHRSSGHRQSTRFPECVEDNFLAEVTEELMNGSTPWQIQTRKNWWGGEG